MRDSIVSGTLRRNERPASDVKICLVEIGKDGPGVCTNTNPLGQYALEVAPGKYYVLMHPFGEQQYRVTLDLSRAGYYRDRLELPDEVPPEGENNTTRTVIEPIGSG